MANTYATRTLGTPTGTTKNTLSLWVKLSNLSTNRSPIFANSNGGGVHFRTNDKIDFYNAGGSLRTNKIFRDTSAWYHIVVSTDTTLGTADDRLKMYINGVQQTSFEVRNNPSQNATSSLGSATAHDIGRNNSPANYFDGLISHIQMVDGTAYDATAFGQYDANGVWTIKTSPSVTYGNNGFFILKDGNSVTDQSGNSNNFTVGGGTLTNTEDNPSNVYTVWNAISTVSYKQSGNPIVFSNGATSLLENGGEYKNATSTVGAFTGKYYFETKMISPNSSLAESTYVGVVTATAQANVGDNYNHVGYTTNSVGYNSYAGQVFTSDSGSNYGASLTNGDILGVALDITNLKVYFSKNGVWQNSGVPTSGSTGTGAVSLPSTGDAWLFGGSPRNSSIQSNFGNGYFGTTAVASAGTNASGNGIFEYDVPTGYTALSTKGLNL
jgi:hypothetical protein